MERSGFSTEQPFAPNGSPMDENGDMDVLSNTPDAEEMDAIMRQPPSLGDDWSSSDDEAGSPPPLASAHLHKTQAEIIRAQRARIQALVRSRDDVSRLQDELMRATQTENGALRQANARLSAQQTPRQALAPATVPCRPHELQPTENFIDLVSDDNSSDSDDSSSSDSDSSSSDSDGGNSE
jgi:hypothetical protein